MHLKQIFVGALALLASPAGAEPYKLPPGLFQGFAVTTSSQVVTGAGSALPIPFTRPISSFLYLENASASATFCVAFSATATITSGACAGGEITLQPGAFRFFDTAVPTDSITVIGSAAGALTVGVY